MYCNQCGEKNLDNADICKKCNHNIGQIKQQSSNTYNQTNDIFSDIFSHFDKNVNNNEISNFTISPKNSYENKGQLLYSTKGKYSSVGIVVGITLYFIGAICFYASYKNSATTPSPLTAFFPLVLFMMPFINAMNMNRSYVEIYENELIGFSIPRNLLNGKGGKFSLTYDKIISLKYQRDTVTFKFASGEYTVQAKKCAHSVVKICKQQMQRYK